MITEFYICPRQIKFIDPFISNEKEFLGIAYEDSVINAETGEVVGLDDIILISELYNTWKQLFIKTDKKRGR